MAGIEYVSIDIYIEPVGPGYQARVQSPVDAQTRTYPFTVPATEDGIKLIRSQIENAVLRGLGRGRTRAMPMEELKGLKDFGAKLFDSLLDPQGRDQYETLRGQRRKDNKGVRLTLHVPPGLNGVPWEFLYDSFDDDFIGLSRYLPIVRYLKPREEPPPLQVNPPLKLLVVIADPKSDNFAPLNVEREKDVIFKAVSGLQNDRLVQVGVIEGPDTARKLADALRDEWHVLHFACHGGFDQNTKQGVLVFENAAGGELRLGSDSLNMLVKDSMPTRLIVLNACDTAGGSNVDSFSSVAGGLVGVGVSAVVAMQFEISDEAAIEMTRAFYGSLASNLPVDAALAEGRKAVKLRDPQSLEWGTPVLYMSVSDGRLFDISGAPEPAADKTSPREQVLTLYVEGRDYIEQKRWQEALRGLKRIQELQPGYRDVDDLVRRAESEVAKQKSEEDKRAQIAGLLASAQEAEAREDWSTGINKYQLVLALDPFNTEVKTRLGVAEKQGTLAILYREGKQYWDAKRWSDALNTFRRLKGMQGNYKDVDELMRVAQGELDREEADAQKRAKIIGLAGEARSATGREDWQNAIKAWQQVLNLDPVNGEAATGLEHAQRMLGPAQLYETGMQFYQAKRWREALESFQKLKEQAGSYKDVDTLISNISTEITKQTSDSQNRARISSLYQDVQAAWAREDWQTAADKLQAILELDPKLSDASKNLVQARRQLELETIYKRGHQFYDAGRGQDALAEFRRLKSLEPRYKDVDALMANAQKMIARANAVAQPATPKGRSILGGFTLVSLGVCIGVALVIGLCMLWVASLNSNSSSGAVPAQARSCVTSLGTCPLTSGVVLSPGAPCFCRFPDGSTTSGFAR